MSLSECEPQQVRASSLMHDPVFSSLAFQEEPIENRLEFAGVLGAGDYETPSHLTSSSVHHMAQLLGVHDHFVAHSEVDHCSDMISPLHDPLTSRPVSPCGTTEFPPFDTPAFGTPVSAYCSDDNLTPFSLRADLSESASEFSVTPVFPPALPPADIPIAQGAKSLLAAVQHQHQLESAHRQHDPCNAGASSRDMPQISIAFSPHQLARLSSPPKLIDNLELPPPTAPRLTLSKQSLAAAQSTTPTPTKKQIKKTSKAAKSGTKLTRRFCHICRSPKDLSRIVACGSGKQSHVFCSSCVQRRLDLNFEELLRRRDWLCPKCHNRCPCSKCRPKRAVPQPTTQ